MSKDFDQQKEELLQEVRAVLDDVEELYHSSVEEGSKEAEQLRGKLQRKLQAAQRKLGDFEEVAAERVKQTARPTGARQTLLRHGLRRPRRLGSGRAA